VIYTLDKSYGKKLLEMAIAQKKKGLHFYLFHELEGLEEFLEKQDVYYLVMGEEIPIETRTRLKGMKKFVLREEALTEETFEEALEEECLEEEASKEALEGEAFKRGTLTEYTLEERKCEYSTQNQSNEIFICKYQKGENILKEIYLERTLPIERMFQGERADPKEEMLLGDEADSKERMFIRERVNSVGSSEEYHLKGSYEKLEDLDAEESGVSIVKEALAREAITKENHAKEAIKKEVNKSKGRKREGRTGEVDKEERQGKVIGVYSPIHRIGKTKFAIQLGKEMAKQESVLYLSLEPFAKGGYFEEKEEGDLSSLLYFGSQENQNLGLCISVMAGQLGKLDYIKPMPFMEDLYRVEVRQWKELLNKILEHSIYQTIILDMSDGMRDLFEILDFCDTVYTLYIEEPIAMEKLKQYTDNLIKTGYDSVLEHTVQKKVELK
jgi:hypothetical protein